MKPNVRKFTVELVGGKKLTIWASDQAEAIKTANEDHGSENIVGLHDNSSINKLNLENYGRSNYPTETGCC
jgi:hypothetical protein